ncbi:MAG: PAS domain S-box protein [Actinomycetota bacterium]|nr:PAS domain S-box protein [Actinomycetota bacterium]
MRVLVVDDDPSGRYLLESIVRSGGHEVLSAVNGEDALAVARGTKPDLIITDILMPKMDGYQLCRAWKSDEELQSIPLAFYTASYTDLADERFAGGLGADAFWRKPLDPTSMLQQIEQITGRPEGSVSAVRTPEMTDETEILQEYSERLVHKLEGKALDLENANVELRHAMEILAEEVSVKANLIAQLNSDVNERKRVEGELRKERDFTRQILDHADTFIVITDADGSILLFSRGAETSTGFALGEVLGMRYQDAFVAPWDKEIVERRRQDILASHGSSCHEVLIPTKSGAYRLLDVTTSVTFDAGGTVIGVNMFGIDITERRRSRVLESIVREIDSLVIAGASKAELLQMVCDRLISDIGDRFTGAWAGLTVDGIAVEVSAGAPGGSRHPDTRCQSDAAEHNCPMVTGQPALLLLATGGPVTACLAHAAEIGCTAVYAVPVVSEGETVGSMTFFLRDPALLDDQLRDVIKTVAANVGTALTLLDSRERGLLQAAALESAGDAIAIIDKRGIITWANHAFGTLTGYSDEEYVGMLVNDLMSDATPAADYVTAWAAAEAGETWQGETVGCRKDGSRYYETLSVARVLGRDESDPRYIMVKRDISESRQLEQLRSGFVANVSHELRTPLTSILGFADVLSHLKPEALPERAPQVLGKIRENAGRMKQLVEELLEVTTMQEEGIRILRRRVDLEQIVRTHADLVRRDSDHPLNIDVQGELPMVMCDSDRIGRVVENLVGNAVKFSPDGGPITILLSANDDQAIVAVRDTGVGIAPDAIPRLFDRFTQGDMSSTRAFGGVGIGLFVADQIIQAHGGTIQVESIVGKGTTFTIHLPIDEE